MTRMEKLADWLTGGELSRLKADAKARLLYPTEAIDGSLKWVEIEKYEDALHQIAALETKGANATVRKMARIAREATK